jgi:hypothetical protein
MFSKLKKSIWLIVCSSFVVSLATSPVFSAPKKPEKPTVTPLPESVFMPKAQIPLKSDRVNLTLINKTNAEITYQVIGDTESRTLSGQQTVNLQGLRAPVTVTLDRKDSGFLLLTPKAAEKAEDTVEATLETTMDMAADATTMRIERNGSVFLY